MQIISYAGVIVFISSVFKQIQKLRHRLKTNLQITKGKCETNWKIISWQLFYSIK